MYVPKPFAVSDEARLLEFARSNNFATLVTRDESLGIVATHVPVLVDSGADGWVVHGHIARANPQPLEGEALVIFTGPHAYVSPNWYAEPNLVPTWNYVAVHVTGRCERLESSDDLRTIVGRLTTQHEAALPNPWRMHAAPEIEQKLLHGIVGFRVRSSDVRGQWKLGQNRSTESRKNVAAALRQRGSPDEVAIADWMDRTMT